MTPYQLSIAVQEYNEKQKMELDKRKTQFEENLVVAYYTALWHRVEKLSGDNLKKVLDKLNQVEKQDENQNSSTTQSPEEMFSIIKQLNAAFGGTTF